MQIEKILELAEEIKQKKYDVVVNEQKYPQLSTSFLILAEAYSKLRKKINLEFDNNNEFHNITNQLKQQDVKFSTETLSKNHYVVMID